MKPLSAQLSNLSDHAKEASVRAKETEDSVVTKRAETRANAQARMDTLKADAAKRSEQMHQSAAAARTTIAAPWNNLRTQMDKDIAQMRANVATTKTEHDAKRAQRDAEFAEEDAEMAIAIALDAVDYAEAAIYSAVVARSQAEAYQ